MMLLLIRLFVVSTITGIILYFIYGGIKYTRMIANIFLGLVYKPKPDLIQATQGERISILDSSDQEISALFLENKEAENVLIFCHESGQNKDSWEKYAYFIPPFGYQVLAIDFRSTSKTSTMEQDLTQWPTEEDVRRVLTAIRWAKKVCNPKKIVLFGISNGADIALAAACRESSVTAVITDGLFSMKEIFRDYIRRWGPVLVRPNPWGGRLPEWIVRIFTNLGFWYSQKKSGRKFVDTEILLKKIQKPLLMIHAEEDDYIPLTHQKLLGRLARSKVSQQMIFEKAGHNESVVVARKNYEESVIQFLRKL